MIRSDVSRFNAAVIRSSRETSPGANTVERRTYLNRRNRCIRNEKSD